MDCLLQNGLLFLYFYYYLMEDFVNNAAEKAFLAFLIIYMIFTYLPVWIGFGCTRLSYVYLHGCQSYTKTFLMLFSPFNMSHLYLIFGPSLSDDYSTSFKEAISGVYSIRNGLQAFLQVTFITILAINQVDSLIKALTIAFSSFEIVFNVAFAIVVNAKP